MTDREDNINNNTGGGQTASETHPQSDPVFEWLAELETWQFRARRLFELLDAVLLHPDATDCKNAVSD